MLTEVFKLVEDTPEQVIVEVVHDNDPLTIARHPYINANWKYISVSKDGNLIYTIIKNDGSSWSFSASTLVSENLRRLQNKLRTYISACGIRLI